MSVLVGQRGVVTGVDEDFNTPTPYRVLMTITRNWLPSDITTIACWTFDLIGVYFIG